MTEKKKSSEVNKSKATPLKKKAANVRTKKATIVDPSWYNIFTNILSGPSILQPLFAVGGVVDAKDAEECTEDFDKLVFRTPPDQLAHKLIHAYSWSIAFGGKDLEKWVFEMVIVKGGQGKVDNIRIVLGIYTQDYVNKYNLDKKYVGRLTAFLWPYLGHNKAEEITPAKQTVLLSPYNLGGLQP